MAKLNANVSSVSPPGMIGPLNVTPCPTKSLAPKPFGVVNCPLEN